MTPLSSSAPLPAREGQGAGGGLAVHGQRDAPGNRNASTPPTPGPSLRGRGEIADTSRLAGKDNLKKAGQQFEAVFTGMMLTSMRKAQLADPLFDSKAIDTFRDMQDQLTVKAMAEHTPLGIGKAMTEFLARSQPDLNDSGPSALP